MLHLFQGKCLSLMLSSVFDAEDSDVTWEIPDSVSRWHLLGSSKTSIQEILLGFSVLLLESQWKKLRCYEGTSSFTLLSLIAASGLILFRV